MISAALARTVAPTTDIYTDGEGTLIIEVHLPGFRREEIVVRADGHRILIQASADDEPHPPRQYVLRESAGALDHAISVPAEFDVGHSSIAFRAGVLQVRTPLVAGQRPQLLAVADTEEGSPE